MSKITQIGLLVKDISVAEAWGKMFDVKPVYGGTEPYEYTNATYYGKPCYGMCRQAFINLENIQIELIAPYGEGSIWMDSLEKSDEGLHHIAILTDDLDGTVQKMQEDGCPVIQRGNWRGRVSGSYVYVDTTEKLKTLLEVMKRDI